MDAGMDAQQTFTFAPIGHIESCFRRLRGIPRQGALAPATKARLVLQNSVQACTADELERFSHVWIIFVFHDNSSAENKQRPGHQDYRAKIAPPKLYAGLRHLVHVAGVNLNLLRCDILPCRGRKVGVFSTRSPHRPNSIGQTVVRYEGLTKFQLPPSPKFAKPRFGHALNLSGVDFVDGTPVLDIKPYVAAYDSVPTAAMAPWVEQKAASDSALHGAIESVQFSKQALVQLGAYLEHMRFYSCVESAEEAVRQVLSLDIHDGSARARKQRRGEAVDTDEFCFPFDGLEFIVQRDLDFPVTTSAALGGEEYDEANAGPTIGGSSTDNKVQPRTRLTVVRVITDDQLQQVAATTSAPEPEPEPAT